jgi:tetratricopeptide (TPR) repeat protein
MSTPFEELGLRAWADPDEIRAAYRAQVIKCHPDMVRDPAQKEAAQQRMIRLNLAYEEALRLASPRKTAAFVQELSREDAIQLAERMLAKGNPEGALRQLMRAESKDAQWHYTHGRTLMAMEYFREAQMAFREAVKLKPDNNQYRAGALEAAVAEKKAGTLQGRIHHFVKGLKKKR